MAALKWLGVATGIAGATIIALNLPIGKQWLAEQPRPLALKGDLPQLRIDFLDPCNMGLGPSSVLRVRRYGPCLTFGCPWSGAQAAV